MLQHLNPRLPHVPAQRDLDVLAGGISAGMKDTGHGMGRLFGQSHLAVHGVKGHAHFDEVGYAVSGFGHQYAHGVPVRQAGTGHHRVPEVKVRGIALAYGGGNAALGVLGVAVIDAALGEDEDTAAPLGQQGGVEPGNAAADDHIVVGTHQ